MTLVPEGWKLRQMNFSGPCADDRKWHLNMHGGQGEGGGSPTAYKGVLAVAGQELLESRTRPSGEVSGAGASACVILVTLQ
jgi:hypothetical protein